MKNASKLHRVKRVYSVFLILIVTVIFSNTVGADPITVVDQENAFSNANGSLQSGVSSGYGQSFTPTLNGLDAFEYFAANSLDGNVTANAWTIRLREGNINGPVLAVSEPVTGVFTEGEAISFPFACTIPLAPGTLYVAEILFNNAVGNDALAFDGNGSYPGGSYVSSFNSPVEGDFAFREGMYSETPRLCTMTVTTAWSDPADARELPVTLDCGISGSETQSTTDLSHTFIIPTGANQCSVVEEVPAGFVASYQGDGTAGSCTDIDVSNGGVFDCLVSNARTFTTIKVHKDFNDSNPMAVEVNLVCNFVPTSDTSHQISDGEVFSFTLTDFTSGEANCQVEETVPDGYVARYSTQSSSGPFNKSACSYTALVGNESLDCWISNQLIPVQFDVRKLWEDEFPDGGNSTDAIARYRCSNTANTSQCPKGMSCKGGGNPLRFSGLDSSDFFWVWPSWNGNTLCTVTERNQDDSVEADDSDCFEVPVLPGQTEAIPPVDFECTLYNTRFYEGIPVLSRASLIILSLTLLGLGLGAARRSQL